VDAGLSPRSLGEPNTLSFFTMVTKSTIRADGGKTAVAKFH
jgi:hypothetical protein